MALLDEINTRQLNREEKIQLLQEMQSEKDKRIIELAESAMKRYQGQRDNKETEWKEAFLMRHGKRIGGYYQGQYSLSSREVHNACRTISSRLRDILIGEDDWFDLVPPKGTIQEAADAFKDYMIYQMDADHIYDKMFDASDEITTYGKGYIKITWGIHRKRHKQTYWTAKRKEKWPGVYTGIEYKKEVVDIDESVNDNLSFQVRPIWALFIDATIPHLQDQNLIIDEMEVGWRHLKRLSKDNMGEDGLYDLKDSHRKLTVDHSVKDTKNVNRENLSNYGIDTEIMTGTIHNRYKLWQMYFWYDVNNDGYEELCMATILVGSNQKALIQKPIEMPYLHGMFPYVYGDFEKDSSLAYNDGVPMICRENHIVLCDNASRMQDNATFRTNNMWMMDRRAGLVPDYLRSEPNKVVPVNNWPGLQPLRPDDMTDSHLTIQKLYEEDVRQSVGALGTLQGLPTRYGTTAKEASQILAQANIVITDIIKRLEKQMIEPLLEMSASLIMQFIDEKQIVDVIGPEGFKTIEYEPWEIKGPCKFMATGSIHVQNRILLGQQLINLLNISDKLPPDTLKATTILVQWLKAWGIKNPEKYINMSDTQELLKPSQENILMNQGNKVKVQKNEDKLAHLAVHIAGRSIAPEMSIPLYDDHIAETEEAVWLEQNQVMLSQGGMPPGGAGGLPGREPPQHLPSTEKGGFQQAQRQNIPRELSMAGE